MLNFVVTKLKSVITTVKNASIIVNDTFDTSCRATNIFILLDLSFLAILIIITRALNMSPTKTARLPTSSFKTSSLNLKFNPKITAAGNSIGKK